MSVDYYMAIDPGEATGIAIGRITEDDAMEVVYTAIVPGGTTGLINWLENTGNGRHITEFDCMRNYPKQYDEIDYHLDVICETFRVMATRFTANVEPLRIEGVIMDRFGSVVHWQQPSDKKLVGDSFLKEHDLWQTGKALGHSDGRDANDALLHLFAFAMKRKHIPTLEAYWR